MATRTTAKPYDVTGEPSAAQQENMDEMFRLLFDQVASTQTTVATGGGGSGSGTPGGATTQVQYNDAGAFGGSSGLVWLEADRQLIARGATDLGNITVNPLFNLYQDITLGARGITYVPDDVGFGYLWNHSDVHASGWEFMWNETAGVASPFNDGLGWEMRAPGHASGKPGMNVYQYGGLGTGAAAFGMGITAERNTDGTGAAAYLGLQDKAGTSGYMWKDANGVFRFHSAPPAESAGVLDTVESAYSLAGLNLLAGAAGRVGWFGRARVTSPADSVLLLTDDAGTAFSMLKFGGTAATFPALKRSSTALLARLADDSADAPFGALSVTAPTVQGSTSASGTLAIKSTSNATKGTISMDSPLTITADAQFPLDVVKSATGGQGGIRITATNTVPVFQFLGEWNTAAMNCQFDGRSYSGTSVNAGMIFAGKGLRGTIATPTATQSGDNLIVFTAGGYQGAVVGDQAMIIMSAIENWGVGARGTRMTLRTTPITTSSIATVLTLETGVQVGAPTGGDKGAGTINCQGDVYKQGTAFTNPDYVFEHAFTGSINRFAHKDGAKTYQGLKPLEAVREEVSTGFRFERVAKASGVFERADVLLEKLEEAYLYIFQLHDRITALEKRHAEARS